MVRFQLGQLGRAPDGFRNLGSCSVTSQELAHRLCAPSTLSGASLQIQHFALGKLPTGWSNRPLPLSTSCRSFSVFRVSSSLTQARCCGTARPPFVVQGASFF